MKATKLEMQFNRLAMSDIDFEEAVEFLSAFEMQEDLLIKKSLLTSAIIAYSRPFTWNDPGKNNESTNQIPISPQKVLSKKELVLHKKVIDLRNNGVAHSAYDLKPVARVKSKDDFLPGYSFGSTIFNPLHKNIEISTFMHISKKMQQACRYKSYDLENNIALTR